MYILCNVDANILEDNNETREFADLMNGFIAVNCILEALQFSYSLCCFMLSYTGRKVSLSLRLLELLMVT